MFEVQEGSAAPAVVQPDGTTQAAALYATKG